MTQKEASAIYDRRFRDPNEDGVRISPNRLNNTDYYSNMAPLELGPVHQKRTLKAK